MCGITGFIDLNVSSGEEPLKKMASSLIHRGPDGDGLFYIKNTQAEVGLAHRRLSIIDLSTNASQPMHDGDLVITFNGEIYNFNEIRSELENKGHHFKTKSDTEVILIAYREWGSGCLDRFIGMFAFVIYNKEKNYIFIARDRAGIKPLFYYWNDGIFIFGSELKSILCHPQFKKELNLNAVAAFLQFGNIPGSNCIYKNTFKLAPGHFLEFDLQLKQFQISKYWNVYDHYNKEKQKISFTEAKSKTEKLLTSAAEYRMIADVPVGVFLSGGYDSACLTALLQKDKTTRLNTYTIGVHDMGLNEAPFAKEISEKLGTNHHEFYCTEKEALEHIKELPYFYDEPFGDHSAIPTSLVCKIAGQYVKVVLSADAGDEVFAGYNRYDYLMKHGKLLHSSPALLRKLLSSLMENVKADKIPVLNKTYNFHNRYEKLKSLLKDPSATNIMMSLSKQFSDSALQNLFINKVSELKHEYNSTELKEEYFTPLSFMMAIDYQTYLPDDILQKVDRASMTHSIEAREPYLDHRLIEWAATLPDEFKYHKGIKKYILKEITHQYLPKSMMDRPKMGFAIPIEKWLLNELKETVHHYLNQELIEKQGIFRSEEITQLKNGFYSGKKEFALKIWYLLIFQMWYERWMS